MYNKNKILSLLKKIDALEKYALKVEQENKPLLKHIHPAHIASANNLLHYLSIRAQDLRALQKGLSAMAISSIGHSESYTLDSIKKIKFLLSTLAGIPVKKTEYRSLNSIESTGLLKNNSTDLFGKSYFQRHAKIMVTLPSESADDYDMVSRLIKTGMNIARINTAHDDPVAWEKMINYVKKAARAAVKNVKIYMDLEGPKIRIEEVKLKSKKEIIRLYKGDKLILTKSNLEKPRKSRPVVLLSLPEIFDFVKCGESVWFDDGKASGVITSMDDQNMEVEIIHAPDEGFKLKAEKGINFPDSNLDLCALTKEDIKHLTFIAQHADMVGYSFVQKPEDVILLQNYLKRLKRENMGIILKIETRLAFENLPSLLLAVMQSRHCGIMIARGDLAVAVGYLRIAEVQEEILWLAEAAHLPVIWATQVLETQVKKGIATRAEISDVVKSVRAECVMLNKGPHILDAIKTIKNIDKRMSAHEDKKRRILRSLHVAKAFVEPIV